MTIDPISSFFVDLGAGLAVGLIFSAMCLAIAEMVRFGLERREVKRCLRAARDEASAIEGGHSNLY